MEPKFVTIDGKQYIETQDGKPVFVHSDGREATFDAPGAVAKISALNAEAKGHREAKEAAESKLKPFEGLDAAAARAALETAKNIKDGELLTAGEVEELKAGIKKAAEEQIAAVTKANAEALAAEKKRAEGLEASLYAEQIGGAFSRSKFIADKVAVPADLLKAQFGERFRIEDGKTVAYEAAGNKIYSRATPGELAEFNEALETIVNSYAHRDAILKGAGGGSGARPGFSGGSQGKTITRAEGASALPRRFRHGRSGWRYDQLQVRRRLPDHLRHSRRSAKPSGRDATGARASCRSRFAGPSRSPAHTAILNLAGTIAAHFPADLCMSYGPARLRVTPPPSSSPPIARGLHPSARPHFVTRHLGAAYERPSHDLREQDFHLRPRRLENARHRRRLSRTLD